MYNLKPGLADLEAHNSNTINSSQVFYGADEATEYGANLINKSSSKLSYWLNKALLSDNIFKS